MTNVNYLNEELKNISSLERSLWQAFIKAEKDFLPPTLHPFRLCKVYLDLRKRNGLGWENNYPLFVLLTTIFAIFAIATGVLWFLIPYVIFYGLAVFKKDKYIESFARDKLNVMHHLDSAFGIEQPSLIIGGLFSLSQAKIDPTSLQSILKIQKASGELSDSGFGIADKAKGFLLGIPLTAIVWIYGNAGRANDLATELAEIATGNMAAGLTIFLAVSLFLLHSYDLIIAQPLAKRKRKRYLLVLTLVAECYTKKPK